MPSRQDACRCGFSRSASAEPIEEVRARPEAPPQAAAGPGDAPAAAPALPAAFRLDVGSVVEKTALVWKANLASFCAVGLIVYSPILLGLVALAASHRSMPTAKVGLNLGINFFHLVLNGAVTYGVFQQLRGQPVGVGDQLRIGLSRLGAVLITGFAAGLLVGLGCCALVVPGLIVLVRYYLAVPVAVIESPGMSAALSRSVALTEGNRWAVFGIMLVVGLIAMLVSAALMVGFQLLGGAAVLEAAVRSGPQLRQLNAGGQALLDVLMIPLNCLGAVAPAVTYHELLVGKEGLDVDSLLQVFE